MKRCTKCGTEKSLDDFYRDPAGRDGRRADCIECVKACRKARYPLVRDQAIARTKAWQEANRERHLANLRRRRQRPEVKARERDGHLRRKFGITSETYDAMLKKQRGRCAICRRKPTPGISLHVDHEHRTKRVRGLLCFKCNNALGDFRDSEAMLLNALEYLAPPVDDIMRRRLAELPSLSR